MDIGESLVAAYFKYVEGIRMVVHNAPYDEGQGELDVIAIVPAERRAILCEVTTHIEGMLYGSGDLATVQKVRDKIERARGFASRQFPGWETEVQIWSPKVSKKLAQMLVELEQELGPGLTLVINERYTERIRRLEGRARETSSATDEPAFRMLQIMSRLK